MTSKNLSKYKKQSESANFAAETDIENKIQMSVGEFEEAACNMLKLMKEALEGAEQFGNVNFDQSYNGSHVKISFQID